MPEGSDGVSFPTAANAPRQGDLLPGTVVGEYILTGFIARGGFSCVYAAQHILTEQRVALKVLDRSLAAEPKVVDRFAREVEVLRRLRHPHIVEIYDVGTRADGQPYFAMEYVEGRTLSKILAAEARLVPAASFELIVPVCEALIAAHEAGIVHRDVKLRNIMLQPGRPETLKLLDFGIAKLIYPEPSEANLTSAGAQIGTITIMAPEQLRAEPVDQRVDVYALGVLLFRMLTGKLPFYSRNPADLVRLHLEVPAPRPSQQVPVPPALDAVVLRCLEKQPARRYDSVRDLLADLRAAVAGPRSRGESNAAAAASQGFAVYVEVRMPGRDDDLDEAILADTGDVLDLVEEHLTGERFLLASASGNAVLGVRRLSAADAVEERRAALEIARVVHRRIAERPDADPRVHVNVCVHVGEIVARRSGSQTEIVGGALLRTDEWAPRDRVSALCSTREAVADLSDLVLTRGPDRLVLIA